MIKLDFGLIFLGIDPSMPKSNQAKILSCTTITPKLKYLEQLSICMEP